MFLDPTFWVAVSFILFLVVVAYFKLPGMITKALDERATKIAKELEDAKRLHEDAQALFAEYQRKQRDAEKEAAEIAEYAKVEAERHAAEAVTALEANLARRTEQAEQKIAQAESQAVQDVRNEAVRIAVAAATQVIADEMKGDKANALIDEGISELRGKLMN